MARTNRVASDPMARASREHSAQVRAASAQRFWAVDRDEVAEVLAERVIERDWAEFAGWDEYEYSCCPDCDAGLPVGSIPLAEWLS
jgi:hypothetical protein